jgi:division protein CdvB (Snf7/Vps24/ESCRT-III family)
MPENFPDKWQKEEKEPVADRIKGQIVPPGPLSERLNLAKKKLNEEIQQLGRISDRLNAKDKTLYDQLVKAYAEHDTERSTALANELAELRKVESRTQYGKYALEKAYTKIEMAKDFGDIVATLVPVGQVVKSVRGTLADFLPSTSTALGEINNLMSETMTSFQGLSGNISMLGPSSEDADKILQEAAAVAETRLKDKLPPVALDQ